jgi:hypothetical protein
MTMKTGKSYAALEDAGELAPAAPPAARRPFETWATEKQPAPWQAAAARTMRGWVIGREVTEAEFDDAIKAAGSIVLGHDLTR